MSDAGKILAAREAALEYPAGQADVDDAAILDDVAKIAFRELLREMLRDERDGKDFVPTIEDISGLALDYGADFVKVRRALIDAAQDKEEK